MTTLLACFFLFQVYSYIALIHASICSHNICMHSLSAAGDAVHVVWAGSQELSPCRCRNAIHGAGGAHAAHHRTHVCTPQPWLLLDLCFNSLPAVRYFNQCCFSEMNTYIWPPLIDVNVASIWHFVWEVIATYLLDMTTKGTVETRDMTILFCNSAGVYQPRSNKLPQWTQEA